jgi:hypothetical protein
MSPVVVDIVAKLFSGLHGTILIQECVKARNMDSKCPLLGFDNCAWAAQQRVLQHGVIPGWCQTEAQGISSPGSIGASLMWPRNDGEPQCYTMMDWAESASGLMT